VYEHVYPHPQDAYYLQLNQLVDPLRQCRQLVADQPEFLNIHQYTDFVRQHLQLVVVKVQLLQRRQLPEAVGAGGE
jgi:hypothetical protein